MCDHISAAQEEKVECWSKGTYQTGEVHFEIYCTVAYLE